jgi:hypothetical protein
MEAVQMFDEDELGLDPEEDDELCRRCGEPIEDCECEEPIEFEDCEEED